MTRCHGDVLGATSTSLGCLNWMRRVAQPLEITHRSLNRESATRILSMAAVTDEVGIGASTWPIGASMLQFPGFTNLGVSVREAGPQYWARQLGRIKREGFDWVEIPSAWLPVASLKLAELASLADVLQHLGLGVCATSLVRQSVIDPIDWNMNLVATHRAIEASAQNRIKDLMPGAS